ncbi:MAG: 2-polyprenylphenol 6-hydroxylase [Pseudomonadota bacterium]|nr:2-polyprenylphenol 6-hydroxylase [Pseudomonadota bacterium]
MFKSVAHSLRLARAGRVLAAHDALLPAHRRDDLPLPARILLRAAKLGNRTRPPSGEHPVATALARLGPSFIKLGQFLATRADLVGAELAGDLAQLQDRLPPFPQAEAVAELRAAFGHDSQTLFAEFGPPVAAASIAQVHRARTSEDRDVAVKILRPGIEQQFDDDLESFFFAARFIERWHEPARRLRPVEAVATLAASVKLEMDLRMEASAIAEMAANVKDDPDFRVPDVDWSRTQRRVLTTEWIDGVSLGDIAGLQQAGFDPVQIAETLIQSFLRHAIRDGFFHADMHPGNLFVDKRGVLAAVDFGIMGRLTVKERRFLAEILFGFITRDYRRVSLTHFDAGYVPDHHDPALFAQALRAIGEPLMDRTADDISMAGLLTQLFQVTGQFDMQTQPQLLLLQKTMVVVEGVARTLNPRLNMWVTAEPVVRSWIEAKLGPQARLEEAAEGALSLGRMVSAFPEVLSEAQKAAHMLSEMTRAGGVKLDPESTEALARAQARHDRPTRMALWIAAGAMLALLAWQVF